MLNDYLPVLFAASSNGMKYLQFLGIMAVMVLVPYVISTWLAKTMRMAEYGTRLGIVVTSLVCGGTILANGFMNDGLKYGVDLAGGVILIYEVDVDENDEEKINMNELVAMLHRRINPSGTKEIVVRAFGSRQVEIIIPKVNDLEIEEIKQQISSAGMLEFQILANPTDHQSVLDAAQEQMRQSLAVRRQSEVRNAAGDIVGRWVALGREQAEQGQEIEEKDRKFRVDVISLQGMMRDKQTGEEVKLTTEEETARQDGTELHQILAARTPPIIEIEVLMVLDDFNVSGSDVATVRRDVDRLLSPCVQFTMKDAGSVLMGRLTGSNLPDPTSNHTRQLGIVLDGKLLSAPAIQSRISDSGQITGNFTGREVDKLVNILNAGKLPNALKPDPISQNQMGAMLGADTIRKGAWAIGSSGLLVILFILVYYKFAGIVACLALIINIGLTLAIMMLIKATLTLPGLAGLVLTVGMSVDANVLIFERIREELNRGSALRLAIRNGFARATTTIVDANLTTLITAIVLYAIGTEQVKGFAVTLILGILMSMFTAIFCSRLVFDMAERARRLKTLTMMNIIGKTQIDFVSKQMVAGVVSVVLILIGLGAVASRGSGIFDIDFNGGLSVTMLVNEKPENLKIDQVRSELKKVFKDDVQYTVSQVSIGDSPSTCSFKITTSLTPELQDVKQLQNLLHKNFKLVTYEITDVTSGQAQRKGGTVTLPVGGGGGTKGTSSPGGGDFPDPNKKAKASPGTGNQPSSKKADSGSKSDTKKKASPAGKKTGEAANKKSSTGKKSAVDAGKKKAAGGSKKASKTTPGTKGKKKTGQLNRRSSSYFVSYIGAAPRQVAQGDKKAKKGASATKKKAAAKKSASKGDTTKTAAKGGDKKSASKKGTEPKGNQGATQGDGKKGKEDAKKGAKADNSNQQDKDAGSKATPGVDPNPVPGSNFANPSKTDPIHWRVPFNVDFKFPINSDTLRRNLMAAAKAQGVPLIEAELQPAEDVSDSKQRAFGKWKIDMAVQQAADAQAIIDGFKKDLTTKPVWQSSNKIESTVSVYFRNAAIAALLASLIGIVAYIWIRFQRVTYGLAAVVALVHDVLITLGAIAISGIDFLQAPLSLLQIDEFKISLPVVAAFLTIIGYSLNDTIVVFDRIREVKGKSPDLTGEMINTSINQTLSRTLLTSVTTLIVVLILYFFGGQGIHTFAYALVVGVLVGTYSSIFVASPVLLWMTQRKVAA